MKHKNLLPAISELDTDDSPDADIKVDSSLRVVYLAAVSLLLVGILDWALVQTRGMSIFTLQQILLLVSATTLLLIPVLVKKLCRQN